MKDQPTPQFTIEEMRPEDFVAANEIRLRSWIDTYVNDELGVTADWVESRNKDQRSMEAVEHRRQLMENTVSAQWVAKDALGKVVGVTGPYVTNSGVQRVGSLYVDKRFHGHGVGAALIQKVIDWHDPNKPIEIEVVSYNERAKAFYRKWGFEEIPGSEKLFADKIPEIRMIRKVQK